MGGRMVTALALALVAAAASAATLEEDEARIEALIRAERAASAGKPAAPPPAVPAEAQAPAAVPVVASVVAPPPTPQDEWLAAPARQAGLPFAELALNVGRRVAITTAGERVHRGVVGSADARQVTLRVKRPGGNATYTLTRNQVLRVDLR
jgi:hypothetical protein